MLLKRLITNRNVHLGALLFGASRYMYRGHFSRRFFEFSKKKKKKTRKENESFFNSIYIYIFKMEKDLDHFAYIHVYIIDRSNEIDKKKDYVYLFFFPLSATRCEMKVWYPLFFFRSCPITICAFIHDTIPSNLTNL